MGSVEGSAPPHQALLGAQHFHLVGRHLLAYRTSVISAVGNRQSGEDHSKPLRDEGMRSESSK